MPSAQTVSEFDQNRGRPNGPMLIDNRRKRLADESKGQSLTWNAIGLSAPHGVSHMRPCFVEARRFLLSADLAGT